MNLSEKIRFNMGKLRTSKLPLSDMIPLMQESADRLDFLEARVRFLEAGKEEQKNIPALFRPIEKEKS